MSTNRCTGSLNEGSSYLFTDCVGELIPEGKSHCTEGLIVVHRSNPGFVARNGYVDPPEVGLRIDHRLVLRGHLLNLPYPGQRRSCGGRLVVGIQYTTHTIDDGLQLYFSHCLDLSLPSRWVGWWWALLGWKAKGLSTETVPFSHVCLDCIDKWADPNLIRGISLCAVYNHNNCNFEDDGLHQAVYLIAMQVIATIWEISII